MFLRLLFIWCLSLLVSSLSAEEGNHLPLAEIEGDPSIIVAGCVNVITGSYCTAELDLLLPGPEPLSFERAYWSGDSERADLKNAWRINHSWKARLTEDMVAIPEASGGSLTYCKTLTKAQDFPRDNSGNQYGPERGPMLPSRTTDT